MREILIGDVHGCLTELQQLIDALEPTYDDHVVFLGDLMDKGDATIGTIRYVMTLHQRTNVTVIKGNHEDAHIQYWNGGNRDHFCADEMARVEKILTQDEKDWIQNLPLAYRLTGGDLVVHGGIPVHMTTDPVFMKPDDARDVLRCRYLNPETFRMLPWNDYRKDKVFWAELYDGRFGHVWFGHEIHKKPTGYRHATCIDTGCYKGGNLTAVVIRGGKKTFVATMAGAMGAQ